MLGLTCPSSCHFQLQLFYLRLHFIYFLFLFVFCFCKFDFLSFIFVFLFFRNSDSVHIYTCNFLSYLYSYNLYFLYLYLWFCSHLHTTFKRNKLGFHKFFHGVFEVLVADYLDFTLLTGETLLRTRLIIYFIQKVCIVLVAD